jgi:hypothetical protein
MAQAGAGGAGELNGAGRPANVVANAAVVVGAPVPPGPMQLARFDIEAALLGPLLTKSNISGEIHPWIEDP